MNNQKILEDFNRVLNPSYCLVSLNLERLCEAVRNDEEILFSDLLMLEEKIIDKEKALQMYKNTAERLKKNFKKAVPAVAILAALLAVEPGCSSHFPGDAVKKANAYSLQQEQDKRADIQYKEAPWPPSESPKAIQKYLDSINSNPNEYRLIYGEKERWLGDSEKQFHGGQQYKNYYSRLVKKVFGPQKPNTERNVSSGTKQLLKRKVNKEKGEIIIFVVDKDLKNMRLN